uniref:DUF4371 domain-containing protein n=1 Tax=Panagrolaimus sp. ES5 TaxID=591445 RepID=A0AC34FQS8_9BILA
MQPVVKLYATLLIDSATAESMKQVILTQLEKDGILGIVKEKLLALISDGASNMHGVKAGLGVKLNEWIHEEPFNAVVPAAPLAELFQIHSKVGK